MNSLSRFLTVQQPTHAQVEALALRAKNFSLFCMIDGVTRYERFATPAAAFAFLALHHGRLLELRRVNDGVVLAEMRVQLSVLAEGD